MNKIYFTLLLSICMIGNALSQQTDVVTLLPESKFYKKLKLTEVSRVYTGDDLFEAIDGGADIFLEYGFHEFVRGSYSDKKTGPLTIELYEMSDAGASLGIYTVTQAPGSDSINIGDNAHLTDYYLAFHKQNYFVRISVQQPYENTADDLLQIARLIDEQLKKEESAGKLLANTFIQRYGIGNCIYFRGNIALSNSFFFHPKNIFNTDEGLYIKQNKYDLVVLQYKSQEEAQHIITDSRTTLEAYYKSAKFTDYKSGYNFTNKKDMPIYITQHQNYCIVAIVKDNLSRDDIDVILENTAGLLN